MSVTFVLLVQHNPRFRQYLLAKVQDSIYESTRARVETRDFHVNSSTMTVVMDQVVVHGTEPATAGPLLRVDRLEIGLAIDSLLGRRWHLREMSIVHPVVHVIVDQAGNNNLPKPPGQTGGGNSELFNLGVRRLALQRGEIYYNDRQSRLEADLHDLELSAYFQPTAREYQGQIGYAQGRIVYAAHAPIAHSLQADFNLSPKKFTMDHLQVIAGKSSFTGNATMENYADSNPSLKANYDAVLATSELARILQGQEVPVGTVRLTGFLSYQNPDHRPLLQAVSVWGMMSSPELAVRDAKLQTTARNVAAKFKLENGTAEVQNLRAQIFGGTLEGRAVIRDVAGAGAGRLEVLLKNVSLSVLQTASANNPMREAHLTGTVNADVQATWGKSLKTLAGRANLTIQASLGENPTTPLEGVIHADYSQAARAVALHNSYLRTPQNSLTLDGAISRFSHLQFRFQARDLHEVELLVKGTSRLKSGPPHSDLGLYGSAQMQGTITGDLSNPQIRAQLAATNFRVKGSGWKSLRAAVSAGRSQIIVSQGELRGGTEGRITFSLESALNNWSYSPANPISAHISASRISLADLDRLANRDDPVAGTLALELHIKGTQRNPTGRGNLVLENATVAQEKVQSVEARFEGNGEVVNLGLHARMAAGKAEGSLIYYPKTQGYKGRLEASNLRIEKFSLIAARNAQVAGAMDVKVEGQGTLERPEIVASVSVPELRVQKQTIQGTNLQARLREGVAELSFDARVAQTSVKASGTVGVAAPYQTDLHLDTGTVPLHDLLALYAPGRADGF
ncbi:MAG TPA: hypothetical protein VFL42_05945, partial [Terriglobales bacterium]|nr:hypothetical protein [Terriglobales bacterium]